MYYDALEEIKQSIPQPESPINDPSTYDRNKTIIATFNSLSDVNNFCNKYNSNNNYNGLKLGQCIQINNVETHSSNWYIAGFDCEYNHKASDGTIKDNGKGIMLIGWIGNGNWHTSNTAVGYLQSDVHQNKMTSLASNLQTVLGYHLVQRNVLLSNSVSYSTGLPLSYSWTTAYCTFPSLYQVSGKTTSIYDDGEANYQLPVYRNAFFGYNDSFSRNLYGYDSTYNVYEVFTFSYKGGPETTAMYYFGGPFTNYCPIIYIR